MSNVTKKSAKKIALTIAQKITLAADKTALDLQEKYAVISEQAQSAFIKNSVNRLKKAQVWCGESEEVLSFIAAHSSDSNIDYLVSLDANYKTIERARQTAHNLLNSADIKSANVVYSLSALSRLARIYEVTNVATFLNGVVTDKGAKQAESITKNFIRAFELFNLITIDGARHKCGAPYSATLSSNAVVKFNSDVLEKYDLI